MKMYDVCIIGAGVVGAFIARELSKTAASVIVLEKNHDAACGASGANSGIVHAGFDAENGTLKASLNLRGSQLMPKIAKELGVSFNNNGSLVIGFCDEDMTHIHRLYDRGVKNGVEGLQILTGEELLNKEPNVSDKAVGALYAPTGAVICPYGLTIAALGNAMDNGVALKTDFEVKQIIRKSESFSIWNGEEEVHAKYIVNAAGTHSDVIARLVGDSSFSITPRKGEYMILDKEFGGIVGSTIFVTPSVMGKGILVSKTADGNIILGPTSENTNSPDDKDTTSEGFEKIIKGVLREVPNVPLRSVITSFAGVRAVGSTGDYIINSPSKNFINVAGIESPGLTSAPAIGEYVVGMLFEMGLTQEINTSFNPIRRPMHEFSHMSKDERNKLLEKEPEYGQIICRCEEITKGEILRALRENPKADTLDGVKKRTRAGMGRCQGGFCSPSIVKLIAEEKNIPLEKVTKSGGKSYICCKTTK